MKISRLVKVFVVFVSACLAHHVHGLPQAGRNWSHSRLNATAYSNRGQQKYQPTVVANNSSVQHQQWQRGNATRVSLGGERPWLNNNQSHPYIQVPGLGKSPNFAATEQASRSNYQPEGERLWLNNNQSHPYIQVPGLGNRPNFAAANQPNRSISLETGDTVGWRVPPSNRIYGTVRNSSTQNYPTTSQSITNPSWSGKSSTPGTGNIGRPTYNSTLGGQIVGPSLLSPGSTPPPISGWLAPLNPVNNANWSGAPSNSPSGGGVNTYPNFNSRLPSSTLVSGNNNQNVFPGTGSADLAPINPGSGYSDNRGQLPPGSVGGSSNSRTPLAPLAGGASWSSSPPQAGLSYSNGQQQPQARPISNSNPYSNLFI